MDLDEIPMTPHDDQAKQNALIAYIFMLLGLVTGVFWLVGAVWAIAKSSSAKGSVFYDHFQNITSVFWWSLIMTVIGLVFAIFFFGYLILLGVWLWSVYKLVKGVIRLTNDQPFHSS